MGCPFPFPLLQGPAFPLPENTLSEIMDCLDFQFCRWSIITPILQKWKLRLREMPS